MLVTFPILFCYNRFIKYQNIKIKHYTSSKFECVLRANFNSLTYHNYYLLKISRIFQFLVLVEYLTCTLSDTFFEKEFEVLLFIMYFTYLRILICLYFITC